MGTFIVAPLSTGSNAYPFRMPCHCGGKQGHVVPDQLRTVDRERLLKDLGSLSEETLLEVQTVLQQTFAV
jgi:mRNA interferase MazF